MARHPRRNLTWILPLVLLVAGCASSPPRQTEFMSSFEGVEISSRELRIRLYAFVTDFAGAVESAADVIHAGSDDRVIRENAILWKVSAIPALHNEVFVEDPLVGCINAYAFCRLMRQYFSAEGAGAEVFGASQDLAVVVSDSLVQQAQDLIRGINPGLEFAPFQREIDSYVANHPLQDLTFTRQSTMAAMAPLMSAVGPGGLDATGAMNEQMRVMNDRLAIYAEFMPKQIRWQTELMLERVPNLADAQREAVIRDVRAEALAAWEVTARLVEDMRADTMRGLTQERVAIMDGIAGERQAILAALAAERAIILATLQAEREATLASIEGIVMQTLESMERSTYSTTGSALEQAYSHVRVLMAWIFVGAVALLIMIWLIARNLLHTHRARAQDR